MLGIILRTNNNRASTFLFCTHFLSGALLWSQLPHPAVRSWLVCEGGTESSIGSVLYSCSQLQDLGIMHQASKHSLAFLPMQLWSPRPSSTYRIFPTADIFTFFSVSSSFQDTFFFRNPSFWHQLFLQEHQAQNFPSISISCAEAQQPPTWWFCLISLY